MEKQKMKFACENEERPYMNRWRDFVMKVPCIKSAIEKLEEDSGDLGCSWIIFGPNNPLRKM